MKKTILISIIAATALVVSSVFGRQIQQVGYILEHEKDIAKDEPGPHDGGGTSTGHNFFSKATDFNLVFRKRVLHPGSAIGYHLQKVDEIYYIISGTGEMTMNGAKFMVSAGDGILTRPGSSHGLKQIGKEDLVVLINYQSN